MKFYRCNHCGNIIAMVQDSGVVLVCCGEAMQLLTANTVDAAQEKHLPVVEANANTITVKVGSVAHPMSEEHHIAWLYVETRTGGELRYLDVARPAIAEFNIKAEEVVAVYEYCNLHGLWKTEL